MKKRIIIHIGTHKTGTTSIQKSLAASKENLLASKILYPDTTREPWPNQAKHNSVVIAANSKNEKLIQIEKKLLLNEFSKSQANTMIISEEGLSEPHSCATDFFSSFKDDFDLSVICYLRRQDRFIESLYNQFIRMPFRHELRSIKQFWESPQIRDWLMYHTILQGWGKLTTDVSALDFDRVVKGDGLVKSFMKAARLDIDIPELTANRSPDMNLILALARINRLGLDVNLTRLMGGARTLNESFHYPALKYLLGKRERIKILSDVQKENAMLERDYGISFSPGLPQDESDLPTIEPDMNYLLSLLSAVSNAKTEQAQKNLKACQEAEKARVVALEALKRVEQERDTVAGQAQEYLKAYQESEYKRQRALGYRLYRLVTFKWLRK